MNFSFSEDQILLKNSVRSVLDDSCRPAHARAMMDDPKGYSEALWGEMAKLGWLGLPFPEQQGGAALGLVELALVCEELGRAASSSRRYWVAYVVMRASARPPRS